MPHREDEDLDQTYADDPPRVLSLTFVGPYFNPSIRGAVIDEDGRLKEHWLIPNIAERQQDGRNDMLKEGSQSRQDFVKKLNTIRPDYIAIAGFHPNIKMLHNLVRDVLDGDKDMALKRKPPCDIVDDDVGRVFRNSARARLEFPTLDEEGRYLVALARKVQDPTMEYAALMNEEMEWKALRLHRNQQYVSLRGIFTEFDCSLETHRCDSKVIRIPSLASGRPIQGYLRTVFN